MKAKKIQETDFAVEISQNEITISESNGENEITLTIPAALKMAAIINQMAADHLEEKQTKLRELLKEYEPQMIL